MAQLVAHSTRCVVGSRPTCGTEHFGFPPSAPRLCNQRPWYVKDQNRGLRICLQSETRTTLYDLHKHSKLQKLEHRRVAHLRNLIFKKTLKAPELQAVPRRSTRANDGPLLVVAQPKNELFKKSVHYKGGVLWNELDGEIRNIKDLNTFKRKTKSWLVIQW